MEGQRGKTPGKAGRTGNAAGDTAKSTKATRKRPYMQWSKRFEIVALAIGAIGFLTFQLRVTDSPEYQYKALALLLEYTFGIIAVYNGNSVSEKYFVNKFHLFDHNDETT